MAQRSPRPDPSSARAAGVVAVLAVLGVVLAGCGGNGHDDNGATARPAGPRQTMQPTAHVPGPSDPRLARYYGQHLTWHDCGGNDCTSFRVPLDYARPQGRAIRIAVLRVPASGKRIGSLVVNPGGPGGSGIQYAAEGSLQFGDRLASRFDIVGFDPRGVGKSAPIECLGTKRMDAVMSYDPDPDTAAERRHLDALYRGFGEGCLHHDAALTRHVSTVEAARDMDVLRALLGERRLDYMGASYGTYLGATYAQLFPHHVGRFVLDGAVDPDLSNRAMTLQQAGGFETALRAYLRDCVARGSCLLGDSVSAGERTLQHFYARLEQHPLPTGDSARPLTSGLAMIGTWLPLYVKSYWPLLTEALRPALTHDDGSKLLQLADLYLGRGKHGYTDNSMQAIMAINCLDHGDSIPTDKVPQQFGAFEKVSPTFGRAFAFGLSTCAQWPVRGVRKPAPIHAPGSPPIVVIGTTRDPATPLAWAEDLAHQLAQGRLIVRDGDGHTGFNQGNSCVDNAVEDFLIDDKVPPKRLNC